MTLRGSHREYELSKPEVPEQTIITTTDKQLSINFIALSPTTADGKLAYK